MLFPDIIFQIIKLYSCVAFSYICKNALPFSQTNCLAANFRIMIFPI